MVNSVDVKEYLEDLDKFPILQSGVMTGIAGLFIGGIVGTIKSPRPGIYASAMGMECFIAGSLFWFTRTGVCKAWLIEPSSPASEYVKASATAGGITGGLVGGILRGPSKIIPATLAFTLVGYAGQRGYNFLDARHTQQRSLANTEGSVQKKSAWRRIADSKYSPMKVLSDEEYEKVLREKVVRVEAEIAVIDEDIEKLRSQSSKDDIERCSN